MPRFRKTVVHGDCGWRGIAHGSSGHGSMFLAFDSVCPGCGTMSDIMGIDFYHEVQQWIPDKRIWWKPWTWFSGHWKTREER
jgi:hypothetical protein